MITVTDAELADLRQRLAATRWPAQWPGMQPRGWVAGVPATELRRLTTAWGNGYDWRRHEAEINALPWGGDAQDAFTVIIPCLPGFPLTGQPPELPARTGAISARA